MQMGVDGQDRDYGYNQFGNDNYFSNHRSLDRVDGYGGRKSSVTSSSASSSPPLPSSDSSGAGVGYIEHKVSKFDTLAGVAIKYGVEVSDVKKMNGLVTDLQMFALTTLHIPLPGRHPPSPCLSDGAAITGNGNGNQSSSRHGHCDLLDSFQSIKLTSSQNVSPAMSSLQGYYGLKLDQKSSSEGFERPVYRKEDAHYLEEGNFLTPYGTSNRPFTHHRKSKSFVTSLVYEIGESINNTDNMHVVDIREGNSINRNEKLLRRCQKSEADFTRTPVTLLKEDNSSMGAFMASKGKGLALRSNAASRTTSTADFDAVIGVNPAPTNQMDSTVGDRLFTVRKSSSTPSLQEQENSSSSSIWQSSMWSLKPDLQARSAAASSRPIFDGLPKPMANWRNKTAVD